MAGLLHLVQRERDWAGPQPALPLLAVPSVTAHPSTASVPITVLLYNGPRRRGTEKMPGREETEGRSEFVEIFIFFYCGGCMGAPHVGILSMVMII